MLYLLCTMWPVLATIIVSSAILAVPVDAVCTCNVNAATVVSFRLPTITSPEVCAVNTTTGTGQSIVISTTEQRFGKCGLTCRDTPSCAGFNLIRTDPTICQLLSELPAEFFLSSSCTYYEAIRLVGGNSTEGRLEVYHQGLWGTVCGDGLTDVEARVACYSLGFGYVGRTLNNLYTAGIHTIGLDAVSCIGTETSLLDCAHNAQFGQTDCTHSQDVAICCLDNCGPRDCGDIQTHYGPVSSGVYNVLIANNNESYKVFCDMTTDGGGWLVFQRRVNGTIDFYRNWAAYKAGFGNLNDEFWLGNEALHQLTTANGKQYELRVDLSDFHNNTAYAEYGTFDIASETDNYKITFGRYSGTAGNSLRNNLNFTTYDVDNDAKPVGNCAVQRNGAWWYKTCSWSNLNGPYVHDPSLSGWHYIIWYHWHGDKRPMQTTEMKIRPVGL